MGVSYIGRALVLVAAVLYVGAFFLPVGKDGDGSFNTWDAWVAGDWEQTAVCVLCSVLTLVSFFAAARILLFVVALGAFYLLPFGIAVEGLVIDWRAYVEQPGNWVGIVASVVFAASAVLAYLPFLGRREVIGQAAAHSPSATVPAAGWYADPSGVARLRFWSGSDWTEAVQG